MLLLKTTDPNGLDAIADEIHDSYFDIEDIDFDTASGVLTIPFRRRSYEEARLVSSDPPVTGWRKLFGTTVAKSWEAPWYRWFLRIRRTDSYRLQDDARIGGADFEEISYDPTRSTIVIEGNVPVTIDIRVHTIDVEVEQTNQILGLARYRTLGSSESYTGEIFPLTQA